nr:zinc finger, CCHC-type, retrotransposon Gag domain protein [Tanacetum cinerariifolium]
MEKIFDVMGCEDAFKTRLAVYKFEGNALAWWKAYKQVKGGDAWLITVTWAEFKKLFFLQFFPRAKQEHLKREYHSIRQTNTETSTKFMQRFPGLAGFLGAAVDTEEEQAKNFQWGLRRSTLNHLMCIQFMDVALVANAARNYEILHEKDDDDAERPDKRFPYEEASMEVLLAKERILKLIQAWDDKQIESWILSALLLQLLKDSRTIDEMLKKQHSIQYKEYLKNSSNTITTVLPTEEPEYSLCIGDEHLSTISETESDEVIKSKAKNLVPIPSEKGVTFDDESKCDVPVKDEFSPIFTTFSNPIFDDNDDFTSSDDELLSNEYVSMEDFKVYSNSLFDAEEINSNNIDPHYFNAESDLIESFIIDEEIDVFTGTDDLMPPGSENDDYYSEGDIHIFEELLSNDTHPIPENESSNFDHHDDPSFPRPPPEPPDVDIFFEPNSCVLTTNVVKENEDKVFKHDILSYLLVSHRAKTTSCFSKNTMIMYGRDIPLLDVPYLHFYPPNQAQVWGIESGSRLS